MLVGGLVSDGHGSGRHAMRQPSSAASPPIKTGHCGLMWDICPNEAVVLALTL
jgi:hypothetical protein